MIAMEIGSKIVSFACKKNGMQRELVPTLQLIQLALVKLQ